MMEEELASLAPRLLRYCLGRTGSREQAEEICQESLAALIQRWRRHGPPDSPMAFTFAVARRRAARQAIKNRLLEPFRPSSNGGPPQPGPEEAAVDRDRLRRTLAAIRGLGGAASGSPRARGFRLVCCVRSTFS